MGVGKKAVISTIWTSGLNYFALAVGFVFGLLRDRVLLAPENGVYGYGMAVVDMVFILAGLSFNIMLIQADREREQQGLYSTAFALTAALACCMAFVAGVTAFVLSRLGTTDIKIQAFLVLALFNIINLFTMLFATYLEKQLEYKRIARINLLSVLAFPLVSYMLVLQGWGAWGMIIGQSASLFVSFVGFAIISHYPVSFKVNADTAKWFLSNGWKLIFARGMEVLFVRFGTLVTERLAGTSLQGSFSKVLKYWEMAPQTVSPAVVTVAMPTYSKLQGNSDKLARAFSMVVFLLTRILMPFVLVFAILPEQFIRIIGEQWLPAVPVLRILAAGALLSPLFENMKQLLLAKGLTGELLKIRVVQLIVFLPATYLLVMSYGISGAAIAMIINYVIGVAGAVLCVRRIMSVGWARTIGQPLVLAAVAGTLSVSFPVPEMHAGAVLQFLAGAFEVTILFGVLTVAVEWKDLKRHVSFITKILKEPDSIGDVT
jgi:O-antigen/teichoic acid export membrane protein